MSAATRSPYLGEDVHFVTRFREEPKCRTAKVTDKIDGKIELYVFGRPVPFWVEDPVHDEAKREIGTYHFAH